MPKKFSRKIKKAESTYDANQYSDAKEIYNEIIAEDNFKHCYNKTKSTCYYNRGMCKLVIAKDLSPEQALKELQEARSDFLLSRKGYEKDTDANKLTNYQLLQVLMSEIQIYITLKNYKEQEKKIGEAFKLIEPYQSELDSDFNKDLNTLNYWKLDLFNNLADENMDQKNYEKAISNYGKALQTQPKVMPEDEKSQIILQKTKGDMFFNLATAHRKLRDYDQASRIYKSAQESYQTVLSQASSTEVQDDLDSTKAAIEKLSRLVMRKDETDKIILDNVNKAKTLDANSSNAKVLLISTKGKEELHEKILNRVKELLRNEKTGTYENKIKVFNNNIYLYDEAVERLVHIVTKYSQTSTVPPKNGQSKKPEFIDINELRDEPKNESDSNEYQDLDINQLLIYLQKKQAEENKLFKTLQKEQEDFKKEMIAKILKIQKNIKESDDELASHRSKRMKTT